MIEHACGYDNLRSIAMYDSGRQPAISRAHKVASEWAEAIRALSLANEQRGLPGPPPILGNDSCCSAAEAVST